MDLDPLPQVKSEMESTRNKKKSRIREKQEQSGKQGVADKSEGARENALNEREAKKEMRPVRLQDGEEKHN